MPIDITTLTKPLPRSDLAQFLPNPRAIDAFESMQSDVAENIPASIAQIVDLTNDLLAAPYIAWQASGTLENERLAAAGAGVTITIGASNATFSLTPSGVAAATYGGGSAIPSISVDQYGRIVSASDIALNSDNVTEGSVNLFYTDARARLAMTGGAGIFYSTATGVITLDTTNTRNVDHASVSIIAGAGLTDGGDLTASRTLNIGAGTGIQVNADDVSLAPSNLYTPTPVGVTNVTSVSFPFDLQWLYTSKDTVCVFGRIDIDPTAAGGTAVGIPLPIASNFTNSGQCSGQAVSPNVAGMCAAMYADATNDRAEFYFTAVDTANRDWYFRFEYRVLP